MPKSHLPLTEPMTKQALSAAVCELKLTDPQPQSLQRITLVYNQASCNWLHYADTGSTEAALHQLLDPLPLEVDLVALTPQSLKQLPQRLRATQSQAIWAAGGDGTVLALARIAKAQNLPLGILPTGTLNLMGRDLGMSLVLAEAIQQLLAAQICTIDMAEVNGHPFLCISNLGVSTRYTQLREALRFKASWVRWPRVAWYMLKMYFKYPPHHICIMSQGQTLRFKSRSVSVTNNLLCENGGFVLSRDQLDAGKLGVYVVQESSAWSVPRLFSRFFLGRWKQDPDLLQLDTTEMKLYFGRRRRRITVMNDGEILKLYTPLHYRLHVKSLKMLRPTPPSQTSEELS